MDTPAHHREALDLQAPAAREEDASFATLIDELHELAARLRSVEARMVGGNAIATFESWVDAERQVFALLRRRLARDRRMLEAMR
jgi:hypothetical protein